MKVLIVGLGAIGTLIGYILSRSSLTSRIGAVVRDQSRANRIRSEGIRLKFDTENIDPGFKPRYRTLYGDLTMRRLRVDDVYYSIQHALSEIEDWNLVVVSVKAYDLYPVVKDIVKWSKRRDRFYMLTVQNGWAPELEVVDIFPKSRLVLSSITIPVERSLSVKDNWDYRIWGFNSKGIALSVFDSEADGALRYVSSSLRNCYPKIAVIKDWRSMKLSKLLLNMIGNVTSAITGIPPDELFKDIEVVRIERQAVLELLRVASALKVKLVNLPGYNVPLIAMGFRILPVKILQKLLLQRAGSARGEKLPSLLMDIKLKRQESELNWLNGAIVKLAGELGLEAKVNKVLVELADKVFKSRVHLTKEELVNAVKNLI